MGSIFSTMGSASRSWWVLWRAVETTLFPPRCAGCRCFLTPVRQWEPVGKVDDRCLSDMGSALIRHDWCEACAMTLTAPISPLCPRCGVMLPQSDDHDHLCGDCLIGPGHFTRARAFGVYQGGLMAAVHQLKYKARLSLAKPLGHMLHATFRRHWTQRPVDLVLPVPLHRLRLRQRGFNQVKLILDAWQNQARRCGGSQLAFAGTGEVLARTRATLPQAGQSRRARRRNMQGAFSVVDSKRVARRHVLLVDDVYTTGATVEEASRCLMRAGAQSVEVLTLARTMPWRSQADCFPLPHVAGQKGI